MRKPGKESLKLSLLWIEAPSRHTVRVTGKRMSAEIAEVEKLLRLALHASTKKVLTDHLQVLKAALPPPAPTPAACGAAAVPPADAPASTAKTDAATVFKVIDTFSWDQGSMSSPTLSVYVDLDGVGSVKDHVTCDFTRDTFDLQVKGLNGNNYRLLQDNLDKDIVPEKSKILVKADKVVVKLAKVKGEFSYDNWTSLQSKKTKEQKRKKAGADKADPMGGIMDMMKDMYETGDDNMKKIIGTPNLSPSPNPSPNPNPN